jgi:hypothetical protein
MLKNINFDMNIILSLLAIGLIIMLISLKGIIVAYSLMSFSVLTLLIFSFILTSKNNFSNSIGNILISLLKYSLPILLILVALSWSLSMAIIYYNPITTGDVSKEFSNYFTLSNLNYIVLFSLLAFFVKAQIQDKPVLQGPRVTHLIYLFSLIQFILLGIMEVILNYFTTDG